MPPRGSAYAGLADIQGALVNTSSIDLAYSRQDSKRLHGKSSNPHVVTNTELPGS